MIEVREMKAFSYIVVTNNVTRMDFVLSERKIIVLLVPKYVKIILDLIFAGN